MFVIRALIMYVYDVYTYIDMHDSYGVLVVYYLRTYYVLLHNLWYNTLLDEAVLPSLCRNTGLKIWS